MSILAIDIATKSGWAHAVPGEAARHGVQRFGRPGADSGEVAQAFNAWLGGLLDELRPAWLVFEAPYVPRALKEVRVGAALVGLESRQAPAFNVATIRRLFGLALIAEMLAFDRRVGCREVSTQEVAKFFLGRAVKGRAEKKAQTRRMAALYGYQDVSEDEADALAVLFYAEARLYPRVRRVVGPLYASARA